ncbi:hypothetical protein NECAME_11046, partial [Necator americanus]
MSLFRRKMPAATNTLEIQNRLHPSSQQLNAVLVIIRVRFMTKKMVLYRFISFIFQCQLPVLSPRFVVVFFILLMLSYSILGQEPQTVFTGTKESREPSGFKHSETRATNGGIHLQGIPLQAKSPGFKIIQLKTVPSVNEPVESVQSGNENIHPAPLGVARIRQNSPIDEEAQKHVPKNEETPAGSAVRISTPEVSGKNENSGWNYCCLICGRSRSAQEVRHSSNKRQQNIVFLACLQVWNIIDMESAKQIYRDLQHSRRRLCHDHYVQAAAYIGKEVEDMWGKFPEHGIDEVPSNIREDLLAYVQVYGEYLDVRETITLSSEDIAQFYYECLKKYYKKKRWSVQEIGKESKKKG